MGIEKNTTEEGIEIKSIHKDDGKIPTALRSVQKKKRRQGGGNYGLRNSTEEGATPEQHLLYKDSGKGKEERYVLSISGRRK